MASLRSKFYSRILRRTFRERGFGEGVEGLERVRSGEDRSLILSLISKPPAAGDTTEINGNYAEWIGNPQAEYTLLYLHGGGYIMGGPETHRSMVRTLCQYANVRALLLDYRLAPENPFPAAVDDAEAAYDWLVARGVAPEKMFVAGDSAGGGLSLALMLQLKAHDKIQPKAAALLSPSSLAAMDTLNSDFIGKLPFGVAIIRPLVTRLTVLSCMPTASATFFSDNGFNADRP